MPTQHAARNRFGALLLGIAAFVLAGVACADPPARVARLGFLDGAVSFSPAGEDDWVQAQLNLPLVTGDRLWADAGARVELQIGAAVIRMGNATSVTLLNLDDRVAQFQLTQGTLQLRVRRLDADQVVEIDTPNLAYVISRPGRYRVSVDPDGAATEVYTREGQAEVYGEDASYVVAAGRAFRFAGAGLRDYEALAQPGFDAFERWALDRDRGYDNSISARYVSRDVIGYQDLDAYGTWRVVPEYGNVWMPTRVNAGWAPYRDGHWAWIDPWGWTWVDDAPWGFAVSHYGRWASVGGGWGWIPGPVAARAVYAPALVGFIGGKNFEIVATSGRVGAVGWFPLGPRDVYRPAYPVSRAYFTNVNVSNTVINNTTVVNVYNNRDERDATNVRYANQQVPGAMIAVPTTAFVQSQPVARASLRVPRDAVGAPVSSVAAVAPIAVSVRGAAPQGTKPPPKVMERNVVARSAPPAAPAGFAAKEHVLTANQGKPVDPSTLAALRPSTPGPAPKIEVVKPARNARPVEAPPARSAQADPRGKGEQPGQPQENNSMTQPSAQRPAPPPAQPAAQPPAQPPPVRTPPAAQPPQSPPAPQAQPPARPEPPSRAPPLVDQPARTPIVPPPSRHPVPDQSPPQESRGRAPMAAPPAVVNSPPVPAPAAQAPEPRQAPPAPAPVARPPVPPQAGAPPAAGPPPKVESRPADDKKNEKKPDKKGDEPAKGDEDPKQKK